MMTRPARTPSRKNPRRRIGAKPPADAAEIADRLHSAAIHLLRRLRRVDEAAGLSAPQLSALSVIVFGGPLRLGDLARAEQVRPPSMTRIVDDLVAGGLVRRDADSKDGRVIHLTAIAKGRRIMSEGRGRRVQMLADALKPLRAAEKRTLAEAVALLERTIHDNLATSKPSR